MVARSFLPHVLGFLPVFMLVVILHGDYRQADQVSDPGTCSAVSIVLFLIMATYEVEQLFEALRYRLENRGIDSQCCHWNTQCAQ